MTPLESLLASKRPRCLDGVYATTSSPLDDRDCLVTAFSLAPRSGGEATCRVLGYPLADYNPDCKDAPEFVAPLSLQWNDDSETCVFDSEIHGYHTVKWIRRQRFAAMETQRSSNVPSAAMTNSALRYNLITGMHVKNCWKTSRNCLHRTIFQT